MKKSKKNGYTLIELLVAITIIASVSALTVVSMKAGGGERDLFSSAQEFAFNVRKVQNLALSPKTYGGQSVCFYGIKINDATSFSLYYNDSNCNSPVKYTGQATIFETINLKNGVLFMGPFTQDIAFLPPEPITYFGGSDTFAEQTITLYSTRSSAVKNIKINRLGSISIE